MISVFKKKFKKSRRMNILDKFTEREKTISYLVIALIISALIFNFLIEPLFKRWNGVDREIKLVKVKLQKAILITKQKDEIAQEYIAYADKLKPKGSDEQEMTYILNELEILARKAGLKIVNMRPKPPVDKESYKRFIVEIETESDMSCLMRFVYDIKNSAQLLKVDRLNLSTKSSQSGVIMKAAMVITKISIE